MPRNPLSLWNFYLRNKRKVVPVVGIQVPSLDRLQRDASTGRYYAARLQGDLVPLEQLIRQVQRIQSEERAFTQLESQLSRNPRDISPLIAYLRQHQILLRSGLPDSWSLGRLQATVATTSADVLGLSRALGAVAQDAAAIQ